MIHPKYTPQLSRDNALKILEDQQISLKNMPVILLGIRGYYLDSMGEEGKNDRGIYDDAIFWITPTDFIAFNANTDPSKYRKGVGFGPKKGMSSLKIGIWKYKIGNHNLSKAEHYRYPAFRQADLVTVIRDGDPSYEDTGYFGINIHRGKLHSTSSEGCQTIPEEQWLAFRSFGYQKIKQYGLSSFLYCLVDENYIRNKRLID